MTSTFKALNREEEIALLRSDDQNFDRTRMYLAPLISSAARRLESVGDQKSLVQELDELIPVAAKRFLANPKNLEASYKFSTYFTWYIAEALKRRSKAST
jgi:hypothetical protein